MPALLAAKCLMLAGVLGTDGEGYTELPSRPAGPGVAEGDERMFIEFHPGIGRYYPPQGGEPKVHFQYGGAFSGVLRAPDTSFKAMLGIFGEHVVEGWAGDPAETDILPDPVLEGRYANTVPLDYRAQFLRVGAQARLGAENSFAFGYIRLSPGYVARIAPLRCSVGSCESTRAVDHGLNLGIGFGAIFKPWRKLGVGVDLSLDSAYFPRGHPGLAEWNNGVSATAVLGWHI